MDEFFIKECNPNFLEYVKRVGKNPPEDMFVDKSGHPYTGTVEESGDNELKLKKEYKDGVLCKLEAGIYEENGTYYFFSIKYDGGERHILASLERIASETDGYRASYEKEGSYNTEGKFTGKIEFYRYYLGGKFVGGLEEYEEGMVTYRLDQEKDNEHVHDLVTLYRDEVPFQTSETWCVDDGECYKKVNGVFVNKYIRKGGKKHGLEQFFDETGAVRDEIEWREGVEVKKRQTIIERIEYIWKNRALFRITRAKNKKTTDATMVSEISKFKENQSAR